MKKTKIIFVVQSLDFLLSHRIKICINAKNSGFSVCVAAPRSTENDVQKIKDMGFDFCELRFSRSGLNPFSELSLVAQIFRLFFQIKPDIVHLITMKSYLYGGFAAKVLRVPSVVSSVSGLGITFSSDKMRFNILRLALYPLYKIAFSHKNQKVNFQNANDRDTLLNWNVVKKYQVEMIRGSGVDLEVFSYTEEPNDAFPVVIFASRLLIDKGVKVFVDAANILNERNVKARYLVFGDVDKHNANSVSNVLLKEWMDEGLVEFLSRKNYMHKVLSSANVVALPSFYGEGVPKVLLEAAACGRVVVTTDHPGCRDAINPGKTGLLVPVKNASALADSIEYLINNRLERVKMGRAGRILAEKEFSDEMVASRHMEIFKGLLRG